MAEVEDVLIEVEAVQAVYGDDCLVIDNFPPHLHVHMKPRTADDSSQQFVEAVLRIQAGPQYPKEPPYLDLIESKGLDGKRQAHLITSIQDRALELSSCLMLVALCEEAVETLSSMNHPDGNCPLCLYPLVVEDGYNNNPPFMKLMSCFHCFHSECIIRWWKWLQAENETNGSDLSDATVPPARILESQTGVHGIEKKRMGNCPVCRKVFHIKDIEHVLDLIGSHSSQLDFQTPEGIEANGSENVLESDEEKIRRQKFEDVLKLQQENNGLIEPKRNEVLLPGMFLPTLPASSTKAAAAAATSTEQIPGNLTFISTSETDSSSSSNKPSTGERKNQGMRKKYKPRNPRNQLKQWVKKENGTGE